MKPVPTLHYFVFKEIRKVPKNLKTVRNDGYGPLFTPETELLLISKELRRTMHLTFPILSNLTGKRNFYLNIYSCLSVKILTHKLSRILCDFKVFKFSQNAFQK